MSLVTDFAAFLETDPAARMASGIEVYRQAVLHMALTKPGQLPLDRDAGADLFGSWMINKTEDDFEAAAQRLKQLIDAEDWVLGSAVTWNGSFDFPAYKAFVQTEAGALDLGLTLDQYLAQRAANVSTSA